MKLTELVLELDSCDIRAKSSYLSYFAGDEEVEKFKSLSLEEQKEYIKENGDHIILDYDINNFEEGEVYIHE